MKNYTIGVMALLALASNQIIAQNDLKLTSNDSIVQSFGVIGIGFTAIDDSGGMFDQLLDVSDEWNMVAFPSRLNFGSYFSNGIGLEGIASYSKYKTGKKVDNSIQTEDVSYYAVDARVTYSLNKIWGSSKWFDPYLGGGIGYTDANNQGRGTMNGIIGFKTWFSDRFGLDFNSTGKWSMNTDKASNHLQHAVSGLYRFNVKKGLTKKGEKKLALIQEMEREQQRVQDSIAAARLAIEEAALAQRLADEKEKARLAAIEKARIEAENRRRQELEDKIKSIGPVYFNFNSSYVNADSKKVLDAISKVLKETPNLRLKITSHTDSRGAATYNKWLSERRVNSTRDYLLALGVDSNRLLAESYGEEQLKNECDDNTYCSEEKHRINRRSEFIIESF
jgi:outer membrane protein OmpA-like peptidoglycan-associated protein